jgi:poly-gamma-glutamate synthesis protein (capsule biosynthesis protein)
LLGVSRAKRLVSCLLGAIVAAGVWSSLVTLEAPLRRAGKTTLTINLTGDIMVHDAQIRGARQPDGTYDFRECFVDIKPYIERADITIGNLETTISSPKQGYSGYPIFKSPESLLEALKYAGFDVLTTANNHSLDSDTAGVVHTLDALDRHGLLHVGTARSPEERNRVLLIEKNGIRVAILAYTFGTNEIAPRIDRRKLGYMVNYDDDFKTIEGDIRRARQAGADVIVGCMHWGTEYERHPDELQRRAATLLCEAGMDIIAGDHPHVVQPMERKRITRKDGTVRDILIVYSPGNFISNQTHDLIPHTDSGMIVRFEIVKDHDHGTVTLGAVTYTPTWVHISTPDSRPVHRVLAVGRFVRQGLEPGAQLRLQQVWRETTKLVGTDGFQVTD